MRTPFTVNRRAVRLLLLDKQGLLEPRNGTSTPASADTVLRMIKRLECVQLDPVSAVERNQHLVLAARLPGYEPKLLNELLSGGSVFEYMANAACVIPVEDYPILEPIRERLKNQIKPQLAEYNDVVKAVLDRLQSEGPLPSRVFKSGKKVHGYWDLKTPNTKETSLALKLLLDAGIIKVVRREGNERFFDLKERAIPADIRHDAETMDMSHAKHALIDKYMRAYRVFEPSNSRFGWHKMSAAERRAVINQCVKNETVVPLQIENVRRPYFILAEDLDQLQTFARTTHKESTPMDGPIRFLPPFDNLLWHRGRIADLFDFDYKWEIYTPQAKRRYGYYAMPILCGDRFIGRIDPRLDRQNGRLIIRLLQLEPTIEHTSELCQKLREALESFAEIHHARDIVVEQTEPVTVINMPKL